MNALVPYSDPAIKQKTELGFDAVDYFIRRSYLENLTRCQIKPFNVPKAQLPQFFRVTKIIYDEQEDINEKLASVYSALQNIGATAILLIKGTPSGIEFYLGTRGEKSSGIASMLLEQGFTANFPGSVTSPLLAKDVRSIISTCNFNNICSVTVVPSVRKQDDKKYVQGFEKLIDTMQGKEFSAWFISSPLSQNDIAARKKGLEQMYSAISPYAKTTLAYGENQSEAVANGTSENFTSTINESISNTLGTSTSYTSGKSNGTEGLWGTNTRSESYTFGTSESETKSHGTSRAKGYGTNQSFTETTGSSKTITIESTNKTVENILQYIDEQFERLKSYDSLGAWETAAYFCAPEIENSLVAASTFKALVSGEGTNIENAYINTWDHDNHERGELAKYLCLGYHPQFVIPRNSFIDTQIVTPANHVSGKELPIFMGIPQKSVAGVAVSTMAEFSRNVSFKDDVVRNDEDLIELGCIHHMGSDEKQNKVFLDVNSFTSHCFIAGSTGSGKSNTTYHLLQEFADRGIPFLVVEPVKGEYKSDFGGMENINIFTSNPYLGCLLKLNPFEFHPNILVLEHIDRLIDIFNACWEMYAAMPAILKNAIEKAYIRKGWDLLNSIYMNDGEPQYPTFSDLLEVLPQIIQSSAYSSDSKGDYTGALVTRVESLSKGITGQIFCNSYSIPDAVLFDQTTIVDLSRIGSTETKSLIMGVLVMRLTEYRMATANGSNKALSHVTVLEEAHNLLKNVSQAQGQQAANPVGKSVEMICNSIAEMRTYGEGFIIVDQSPSSVDIAAIKNTNTKIVMRLPEKGDCEAIGNSLGLNDLQVKELSKLSVGVGAVMQNNWLEAVLCKVHRAGDFYYKSAETCSYEDYKAVRSVVVNQILAQSAAPEKTFAIQPIYEKLKELTVPAFVMKETLSVLRGFQQTVDNSKVSADMWGNFLIQYIGAGSIFEANTETIAGKENDETALVGWKKQIFSNLKHIVSLPSSKNYDFLLKRMLYSYTKKNSGSVNYDLIYSKLYR